MVRLKLPDFSKFHCNPHKNGGLRRLLVICALVIVFIYGLQTTLIVKSSDQSSSSSTNPPSTSLRPGQIRLEEAVTGLSQDVFLEANRCVVLSDPCDKPYFPYRISVGTGEHPPLICWNLQDVPLKTSRPGTLTVLEIGVDDGAILSEKSSTADSPKSISSILAQLKSTRNDSYIVMVTWNAVPFSPTLSSHLKSVGTMINPKFLGQGVQFYVLGQKGLLPGRGISDVQLYNASPSLDRTGCVPPLASSLGNEIDHDFANSNSGFLTAGFYKTGTSMQNCGLREPCAGEMLPVHVYSGKDHNDPPRLCINGTYVFENKINHGGRGINIAVINGPTAEVSRVGNFDTWGTDSIMLELFLEDLQPDDIAIIFTHDEASTKLSDLARTLFFDLGSSRIYDLKFRAAWFMIGQKGIRGFSGHEALKIGDKTNWAEPLDLRFCLERRLPGYPTRPDPLPDTRNLHRLQFCQVHSTFYGDFCTLENKLAPLVPAKLADVSLVNSPVYSDLTIILVIAPASRNLLRLLLETLLGQPGVNPRQVRIAHRLVNDTETEDLVKLFNFHVFTPAHRSDYSTFVKSSIEETLKTSESRYLLLLEENTVLSPDFLYFLAVQESVFEDDPTINAIGAWNDNGFVETSGSLTRVYRAEGFPSQAWLATRTFLDAALQDADCCSLQTARGWFPQRKVISVIPDMSRVAKVVLQDSMTDSFEREMFLRARHFSMQNEVKIERDPSITADKYAAQLTSTIAQAAVFRVKAVNEEGLCQSARDFVVTAPSEKTVAVLMDRSGFQGSTWYTLCRCFQLLALPDYAPRNLYNGTLSFTVEQRLVVLVAPDSSFYLDP